MFKEYAVDPRVIASSFETCRYLISLFGADTGRLIAKFPKRWKKMAIEAADLLPDGFKKERVIEYLSDINNDWLTIIGSGRNYQNSDDWLDNAITMHLSQPFHAIVCDRDDSAAQLIDAHSCDEQKNPLLASARTQKVKRNADDIAKVAILALQNCRQLRLVDPYFNPSRPKWRDSLATILSLIPDISLVECEYHLLERDDSPSFDELINRLSHLQGVIPEGGHLKIIIWKEKEGGERFHRRYLLTNNAGLMFEGGLDPATRAEQTTDVVLLDRKLYSERWAEYELTSEVYALAHPVLIVNSNGNVTQAGK